MCDAIFTLLVTGGKKQIQEHKKMKPYTKTTLQSINSKVEKVF